MTVTSSTYSQLRAKLLYHSYNLKNPIRDDNFILSDNVFKLWLNDFFFTDLRHENICFKLDRLLEDKIHVLVFFFVLMKKYPLYDVIEDVVYIQSRITDTTSMILIFISKTGVIIFNKLDAKNIMQFRTSIKIIVSGELGLSFFSHERISLKL